MCQTFSLPPIPIPPAEVGGGSRASWRHGLSWTPSPIPKRNLDAAHNAVPGFFWCGEGGACPEYGAGYQVAQASPPLSVRRCPPQVRPPVRDAGCGRREPGHGARGVRLPPRPPAPGPHPPFRFPPSRGDYGGASDQWRTPRAIIPFLWDRPPIHEEHPSGGGGRKGGGGSGFSTQRGGRPAVSHPQPPPHHAEGARAVPPGKRGGKGGV